MFKRVEEGLINWKNTPGEDSAVEPPVPIPNTEVKSSDADGSVAFAMWE